MTIRRGILIPVVDGAIGFSLAYTDPLKGDPRETRVCQVELSGHRAEFHAPRRVSGPALQMMAFKEWPSASLSYRQQ